MRSERLILNDVVDELNIISMAGDLLTHSQKLPNLTFSTQYPY